MKGGNIEADHYLVRVKIKCERGTGGLIQKFNTKEIFTSGFRKYLETVTGKQLERNFIKEVQQTSEVRCGMS